MLTSDTNTCTGGAVFQVGVRHSHVSPSYASTKTTSLKGTTGMVVMFGVVRRRVPTSEVMTPRCEQQGALELGPSCDQINEEQALLGLTDTHDDNSGWDYR